MTRGKTALLRGADEFALCSDGFGAGWEDEVGGSLLRAPQRPGMLGLKKMGSMRNSRKLQFSRMRTGRVCGCVTAMLVRWGVFRGFGMLEPIPGIIWRHIKALLQKREGHVSMARKSQLDVRR